MQRMFSKTVTAIYHLQLIGLRDSIISKNITETEMCFPAHIPRKNELYTSFQGKELCFFVIFYAFAVSAIVLMFELLKPVLFNPSYPDND